MSGSLAGQIEDWMDHGGDEPRERPERPRRQRPERPDHDEQGEDQTEEIDFQPEEMEHSFDEEDMSAAGTDDEHDDLDPEMMDEMNQDEPSFDEMEDEMVEEYGSEDF